MNHHLKKDLILNLIEEYTKIKYLLLPLLRFSRKFFLL